MRHDGGSGRSTRDQYGVPTTRPSAYNSQTWYRFLKVSNQFGAAAGRDGSAVIPGRWHASALADACHVMVPISG